MNADWRLLQAVDGWNGHTLLHGPALSDPRPGVWLGMGHLTVSRVLGEAPGSD